VLRNKDKTGLFRDVTSTFLLAVAVGLYFNKTKSNTKGAINHVNLPSLDKSAIDVLTTMIIHKNPDVKSHEEVCKLMNNYAEYGINVIFNSWKHNNFLFDINKLI